MGILNVDTTQMNEDAEGFTRISDAAREISSYMQNAIGHLGTFWGSSGDPVADTFSAVWPPGVKGLIDTSDGVGGGMRVTAGSINDSAKLYLKSNGVNTELAG